MSKEEKVVDEVVEEVASSSESEPESIQKKKKYEMTPARKAAFEKARLKRLENIAKKKELKEMTSKVKKGKSEVSKAKLEARKEKMEEVEKKLKQVKKQVKKQPKVVYESSSTSSESEPEVIYVKKPRSRPPKTHVKSKKTIKYVSDGSSDEDYYEPDGTSQYYSQFYY